MLPTGLLHEASTSCSVRLFVCYINDIEKHLAFSTPYLFADDIALLVEGNSISEIGNKLNSDLQVLNSYFAANKLQLNASKTKSLLFRSTQKFKDNNELLVHHLDYIARKSKQRTAVLWRMRGFISKNLAFQLFTSLIRPLYLYCDFIYDGCSNQISKQFEVLQNSALKAVRGVPGRYSATELRDELKVETLKIGRMKSSCVELYKLLEGNGPQSLVDEFKYWEPRRQLRSSAIRDLDIRPTRTRMADHDFVIRAATYWKKVPEDCRRKESVKSFKESLNKSNCFNVPDT